MTATSENRTIALSFLECLGAQDHDRLWRDFLTDESTWTMIAPRMQPLRGKGIADFFAGGGAIFENGGPVLEISGVTTEGERVAVEATGTARLRNGREYANRYHFLIVVRDGRVAAVREYMDSQHVAEAFAPGG